MALFSAPFGCECNRGRTVRNAFAPRLAGRDRCASDPAPTRCMRPGSDAQRREATATKALRTGEGAVQAKDGRPGDGGLRDDGSDPSDTTNVSLERHESYNVPAALGKPKKSVGKSVAKHPISLTSFGAPFFDLFDDRIRREIAICRGKKHPAASRSPTTCSQIAPWQRGTRPSRSR